MTHDDELRRRAERGETRGAHQVWAAAMASEPPRRRPGRAIAAAAALIGIVAAGGIALAAFDDADTDVGGDLATSTTSIATESTPPTTTTESTESTDDDPVPLCDVAVLNANARFGTATLVASRIQEYLVTLAAAETPPEVLAFNATSMPHPTSAVLLPADVSCRFEGLFAEPVSFPDPTPAPWPEDLAALVPQEVDSESVVVIVGVDTAPETPVAERVVVPQLAGLSVEEAFAFLEITGFERGEVVGSDDLPVLFSVPRADRIVDPGTSVTLHTEL